MEVYGIGTDIVEIDRVKDAMERTPTFKTRVFTEREITYVEKKKMPYHSYAARFAAKEAVSKAVGTGIRGFSVLDIEKPEDIRSTIGLNEDEFHNAWRRFKRKRNTIKQKLAANGY